jgi:uncharacterized membrane protein
MINIPLIILMFLLTLGLGIDIAKHGETKKDTYNGWISLISYIINGSLVVLAALWSVII